MKFYLTVESQEKIKSTFINLSVFHILDVNQIIVNYGLDMSKPYNEFFLNQEIEKIIAAQTKSKRVEGIIYINPKLNESLVIRLNKFLSKFPKIESIVLIDDATFPKIRNLHHMFEEVLFFPSVKRVKILECKTLPPFSNEYSCSDTLEMLKNAQKRKND